MNLHPAFLTPDATVLLEIVAVVVLFAVLTRFVLPRLRGAADHRARQVEAAQELLRQATVEREASQREAAHLTTEARLEAHQVLTDARSLRDLILTDARERAREEHASILAQADRAAARRISQPVTTRHPPSPQDLADSPSPGERTLALTTRGR